MHSKIRFAVVLGALTVTGSTAATHGAPLSTLYGADATTNQLIQIDTTTGAGVAVGPLGDINIVGLAYDPTTDTLFGGGGSLYSIDRQTAAATPVGVPSGFSLAGLAVNPISGELYAVDSIADVLLTIDKQTGAAAVVGPLGGGTAFSNVTGLAFDPTGSTLYGVENGNDQLVTIDPATGAATGVGSPFTVGGLVVTALAFDPLTGDLFGSDAAGLSISQLVAIDPATGVGAAVGPTGFDLVEALAFAPPIPEPAASALLVIATIALANGKAPRLTV